MSGEMNVLTDYCYRVTATLNDWFESRGGGRVSATSLVILNNPMREKFPYLLA